MRQDRVELLKQYLRETAESFTQRRYFDISAPFPEGKGWSSSSPCCVAGHAATLAVAEGLADPGQASVWPAEVALEYLELGRESGWSEHPLFDPRPATAWPWPYGDRYTGAERMLDHTTMVEAACGYLDYLVATSRYL